jgi:hypothetical protein
VNAHKFVATCNCPLLYSLCASPQSGCIVGKPFQERNPQITRQDTKALKWKAVEKGERKLGNLKLKYKTICSLTSFFGFLNNRFYFSLCFSSCDLRSSFAYRCVVATRQTFDESFFSSFFVRLERTNAIRLRFPALSALEPAVAELAAELAAELNAQLPLPKRAQRELGISAIVPYQLFQIYWTKLERRLQFEDMCSRFQTWRESTRKFQIA